MQIPQITVVLTQGGRQFPLRGSVDTGFEGLAVLSSIAQSRVRLPIVGSQKLMGFGGVNDVAVAKADTLSIKDSPLCSLKNPKILVTNIPGNEEILLGEEFFKQFSFDINYVEGQPVVLACGERVSMLSSWTSSPWFIPSVAIGGVLLLGAAYSLMSSDSPDQKE